MKLRRRELGLIAALSGAAALGLSVTAGAQAPVLPVQWKGILIQNAAVKPGAKIVIQLSAEIQDGWHVYGLAQLPGGPTPLTVTVDANDVAQAVGTTSGTAPIKKHDTAFDLDTEVYERSLELHQPVLINRQVPAGKNLISVSVRLQACNDRVCLPPRAVHISVPVEISNGN